MSDEITTTLTFVPCTIHTPSGSDIAGFEAVGTGLGYSRSAIQPGFDTSYAIVHMVTGSMLCPMEAYAEQAVRDTLQEIITGKFADWTQSQEVLQTQVTKEQYDAILAIVSKHERTSKAKAEEETIPFDIAFTACGRIRVRAVNRYWAERIVVQMLEELDIDNPEIEDYFLISADID